MKVALVGPYPVDTSRIPGGVAAVIFYLAEGLAQQECIELHVVSPTTELDEDTVVQSENLTVHYAALPRRRVTPNLLVSIRRVQEVLEVLQPDIVHGESAVGTLAGLKMGCPTVHSIHGIAHREIQFAKSLPDKLATALNAWLVLKAVRGVKHCVATSNYAERAYSRVTAAKMHRIFNPVEDRFFDLQSREVENKMLSATLMSRRKNVLGLVRAFDLVHQKNQEPSLFICGKIAQPDYNAMVQDYVKSHNLQQSVNLLGFVSQEELTTHFSEAAVICLFSLEETAPVLIAQAMCAGKPVVASAAGGSPDLVIDGETGFIVGLRDEKAFAERSLRLLSDAELRRKMGERAREVAEERFRKEVVAAKTEAVYKEVLGEA